MFHLKSIVSRSAAIATRQQLSKFVPVTILPNRNYADHQIPERLKNVETAKGFIFYFSFFIFFLVTHLDFNRICFFCTLCCYYNCDKTFYPITYP